MPFKAFHRDETDAILGAVVDVECKYDTVNMYDIGILSWAISQWTLRAGSLQKVLYFIRMKLLKQNGGYKIEKWRSNWQEHFEKVFENILLNSNFAFWGTKKAEAANRQSQRISSLTVIKSIKEFLVFEMRKRNI